MFKWLHKKPKLSELLEKYLTVHPALAPTTVRGTRRAWNQMVAIIGNKRVCRFSEDDAEKVQAIWIRRFGTTSTPISYRKTVSPLFTWSVKKGWIKTHPFTGLKKPRVTKRKVRTYSTEEFKSLLRACGGNIRWITILMIARTTGMRKSEIQNLTKSDVKFEKGTIIVSRKLATETTWPWQPKNRKERELPLTPAVASLITELLYSTPVLQPYFLSKPVRYCYLMGLQRMGLLSDNLYPISNFDRKFRKIKQQAQVDGHFHDLRSTCLTDLADVLNLNELQAIADHSDIKTTTRYIGIGRDTVSKARERVSALVGA